MFLASVLGCECQAAQQAKTNTGGRSSTRTHASVVGRVGYPTTTTCTQPMAGCIRHVDVVRLEPGNIQRRTRHAATTSTP